MTPDDAKQKEPSPQDIQEVKCALEDRRLNAKGFCDFLKRHKGIDIHPTMLAALVEGKRTSISDAELQALLAAVKDLPKAPRVTGNLSRLAWVNITRDMRDELNALFEETGLDAAFLVRRYISPDAKLSAAKISNWRNGRAQTVDRSEWDYLIALLKDFKSRQRP